MVHPKANAHWQVCSSASAVDMCRARKGGFQGWVEQMDPKTLENLR
jgi:hypothetical protein